MLGIVIMMLCGLSCRAVAKDAETKGRYNTPVLNVQEQQLVLEKNQMLELQCRGRWELEWVLPSGVPKDHPDVSIKKFPCGKLRNQYCSQLVLSPVLASHTGFYRCRYVHKQNKKTSVYVFIKDSQQPFVKNEILDMVYLLQGKNLVFPCRVTNPDTKVSLIKHPNRTVGTDQRNIIWNNKKGFIIRSPTFFYTGLFFCNTTINGTIYTNKFIAYRPVNKINDIYLNSTGLVHALRGKMLALNCTVTTELNSRVKITWTYPGKDNSIVSIHSRIVAIRTDVVTYSLLTIRELSKADNGVYICHATSGHVKKEVNTSVVVYDKPFIRLKHRGESKVHAHAGQKSFQLSPKLQAFPEAEVIWLKDGKVAAEQCSRYHVNGSSLVIRDVAQEDAGSYTVLTRIQQFDLHKNLTLTLVVNVKPQIGKKAVQVQSPLIVQRFNRQALRCTGHGIPSPYIKWSWHPCPPKGLSPARLA